MNLGIPLAAWLVLGAPSAIAFGRRGRWDLALAVLPFAGGLAITCPWILSVATEHQITGWFVEAAFASLLLWALLEVLLGRRSRDGIRDLPPPRKANPYLTLAAASMVLIVAGVNVYWGLVLAKGFPYYHWDGYHCWLLRAKVLAGSDAFPRSLATEPMLAASCWGYPLFLPALLAWFRRLGGLQIRQLAVPLGLLAAIVPAAGWLGLRRYVGAGLAAAVVLAPFAIHGMIDYHFGAYADPLLVMEMVIALALGLAGVARGDRGCLVAGSLALAAATATKNEGALWLVAGAVGVGLFALDRGIGIRKTALALLRWASPAVLFFVAWRVATGQAGVSSRLLSKLHFVHVAKKMEIIFAEMANRSFFQAACLVIFPLSLAAMILLAPGRWNMRLRRVATLLATPLLYCAGLVLVYSGLPHELKRHLANSVERVLYGVAPVILVAAIFAGAKRKTKTKPAGKSKPLQPAER